jgi:Ni2+-binding GTPase involved in maturation of urease and hydrogenase
MFSSLQVQLSDLIVIRKITMMKTMNVTIMNVLNSQIDQTRYAFSITTLNLVKDMSMIKIEKPTLRNSQIPLLSVKGVNLQNPSDSSKYLISL